MKFSISIATIALALTASAAPTEQHSSRAAALSGSGLGSISKSGDASFFRSREGGEVDPHGDSIVESRDAIVPKDNGGEIDPHGADALIVGRAIDPSTSLVALPSGIFDPHSEAQDNALCSKVITMAHKGITRQIIVADISDEQPMV
ncbi:hypothetical protein ACHAQJ_002411 [Trichoderma viride]